jgi:hypothetical protein
LQFHGYGDEGRHAPEIVRGTQRLRIHTATCDLIKAVIDTGDEASLESHGMPTVGTLTDLELGGRIECRRTFPYNNDRG